VSKVITTAPTDRQVRHLLWSEIRKLHAHAALPLPGEVQSAHWQMPGEADWFMMGFSTTPDTAADHATRFTGYHSPHEIGIFEEAAGIQRPIQDAVEGLLTSGHQRMLAIGNPTDPNGVFARALPFEAVARHPDRCVRDTEREGRPADRPLPRHEGVGGNRHVRTATRAWRRRSEDYGYFRCSDYRVDGACRTHARWPEVEEAVLRADDVGN
jgi:hypothetical protein